MMIDLLLKRRSVVAKNMCEPGPDPDELQQILEAGIRVPDHGKIGPWRIQVLHEEGQKALGNHLSELYRQDNPNAEERLVEIERQRPCRAPILLVVSNRIQKDHPKIPAIEQVMSGGAVCQNLLVAAHSLGYVAQWLTEWPAFDNRVKSLLGHDVEDDIIGMIYIGSAKEAPAERNRPSIENVVSVWNGV